MITYDPPSVLEFRWGDNETLRFELHPDGQGSVLTFLNTFDDLGKAARDAAGWHTCLDVLVYHLNGEEAPWTPAERRQDVLPHVVAEVGGQPAIRPDREQHQLASGACELCFDEGLGCLFR